MMEQSAMPGGLRTTKELEGRRHDKGCGCLPSTLMSDFLRTHSIFSWPLGGLKSGLVELAANIQPYSRKILIPVKGSLN